MFDLLPLPVSLLLQPFGLLQLALSELFCLHCIPTGQFMGRTSCILCNGFDLANPCGPAAAASWASPACP